MKIRILIAVAFFMIFAVTCSGEETKVVKLPPPQTEGGKPLMQVLKDRQSSRDFSGKELPVQVLSDLLWAACGVNRPDSGKRTAPTAKNMQEVDVYVAKADGLYLYDAAANSLVMVLPEDIRKATGGQPFVGTAPVELVFVADMDRMAGMPAGAADFYAAADTGFISQNVYLYSASAGLATVVRGWVDKPALARAMKLRPSQKVILAQTVGYPGK